jgi:WD40 repeat protein
MWDATSGAILSRFKHQGPVYAVAFNRDGTQVLSGSDDTDMNLWDATSGALLHRFTAGTTVWSVAFNRDGTIGAAGTLGQAVIVWNLQSGDEIVRFKDHSDQVKSVAFSPVSDLLASGSGDNSVFLWDITSGAIVAESSQPGYGEMKAQFLPGSTSQAVFYGCKTLAGPESETCLEPGQGVYAVWDLGSQHPIPLEAAAPEDVAYLVATSINGHVAASSDQIGSLFTWDVQTGKVIMRFPLMNGIAFAAALAPDGKRMVSGGCTNSALCLLGELILWDTTTGEPIRRFAHEETSQNPTVTSVAFTPHGSGIVSGDFTGAITLWDSNTGGVIWRADDATALTTAIVVTPDQRTVISGHLDGSILQWDMATGELIRRFSGHTETIESLALNLDGSRLASGSDDATVIVWDIATGTILRRFDAQGAQVYGVSFSPDGAQLLSTASDGTCILWRIAIFRPSRDGALAQERDEATNAGPRVGVSRLLQFALAFRRD